MADRQRILVIGSGGIAGLYGALLHKAGWQVDMVARSDHVTIQTGGLTVDSILGDLSFRPTNVYASTADAGIADWILIGIKMLPQTDLKTLLEPVTGPNTRLFLIANGLDVDAPLAAAFPQNPLISCVAFVSTTRLQAGHIHHSGNGHLKLGNFPHGSDANCHLLADTFSQVGIKAKTSQDIVKDRWKKSLWNASFNPLSVLANGADTNTMLATPDSVNLVRHIMREVIEIANAEGHQLSEELIDANIKSTLAMDHYINSMAQDYLQQRPLELDAIVGRVVHHADQHELAIPHLRTLYAILKMRNPD